MSQQYISISKTVASSQQNERDYPISNITSHLSIIDINSIKISPDEDMLVIKDNASTTFTTITMPNHKFLDNYSEGDSLQFTAINESGKETTITGTLWKKYDNITLNQALLSEHFEDIYEYDPNIIEVSFYIDDTIFEGILCSPLSEDIKIIEADFVDSLVVTLDDGSRRQIILPGYHNNASLTEGKNITLNLNDSETLSCQITKVSYAEHEAIFTNILTSNKDKSPAKIVMLNDPSEYTPHKNPFENDMLLLANGKYYQLSTPANAKLPVDKDNIVITYQAASQADTDDEWCKFKATVIKSDIENNELTIAGIDLEISMPDNQIIEPISSEYTKLNDLIQTSQLFEEGSTVDFKKFQKKLKRLTNKLKEHYCFINTNVVWDEQNKSIRLQVSAVTPVCYDNIIINPLDKNTYNWLNTLSKEEITGIEDFIRSNFPRPLTQSDFEKAIDKITRKTKTQSIFMISQINIKQGNDGEYALIVTVIPKPTELHLTAYDEATKTLRHFGTTEETNPLKNPQSVAKTQRNTQSFLEEISQTLASEGKILAVRTKQGLVPYTFNSHTELNQQIFSANQGEHLVIVNAPTNYHLGVPDNKDGKLVYPNNLKIKKLFSDSCGQITSSSIIKGLAALKLWYILKGYIPTNNSPRAFIDGQNLYVDMKVLKLESDISLIMDPNAILTASTAKEIAKIQEELKNSDLSEEERNQLIHKKERLEKKLERQQIKHDTCIKNIQNKIQQSQGDLFNKRKIDNALYVIKNNYGYDPTLYYEQNPEANTAQITILLGNKENLQTDSFSINAGYSSSMGAVFSSQVSGTTFTGYEYSTGMSTYPFQSMLSAAASITTPSNEAGGQVSYSVSGSIQPTLSSLGASLSYKDPIGDSYWSLIYGIALNKFFGPESLEHTDLEGNTETLNLTGMASLYAHPFIGIAYNEQDFGFSVTAGPHFGTEGFAFAGLKASLYNRFDFENSDQFYAEVYAKAGILLGNLPEMGKFLSVPVDPHGMNVFYPAFVTCYAMAGANLLVDLPKPINFLDIGVGAKAAAVGSVFTVGAGVVIKLDYFGINILVGPAIVNGVPTLISASFF